MRAALPREQALDRDVASDTEHAATPTTTAAPVVPAVVPAVRTASSTEEAARVVDLARLFAERIVGHAVNTSDEALVQFALTLLAENGGSRTLTLHAHPEHATRLRRALTPHDFGEVALVVQDDAALARGELRFESPEGQMHGSVAASLETLARVALAHLTRDLTL